MEFIPLSVLNVEVAPGEHRGRKINGGDSQGESTNLDTTAVKSANPKSQRGLEGRQLRRVGANRRKTSGGEKTIL